MAATTRRFDPNALHETVCVALELGEGRWKVGFSAGFGEKVLRRQVVAREGAGLLAAIQWAKRKLGLPERARVVSLYEAGREGFWLHRFLVAHGVENLVIDSSSLEVNRRRRRAKTDRLDLEGLLDLLLRHLAGSRKRVFSVVRVPSVEEEDRRHLHRELQSAKRDRTRVTNRMKGLLANQGLTLDLKRDVPAQLTSCGSGMGGRSRADSRCASRGNGNG
jgi:transposase